MGRTAMVFMHGIEAGMLVELYSSKVSYEFKYKAEYAGVPISLTMPLSNEPYKYDAFPPFFDGLLPEGLQLESLLKINKIDRHDLYGQLCAVGGDLVGAVTVKEIS